MGEARQKLESFGQKQPNDKPVLVDAIDTTVRAIQHRTTLYRNLVVWVCVVSLASFLAAAWLHRWLALAGLILLVPLTGAFLLCDSRLVGRWRNGILEMAHLRGLDVAMFRKTISTLRYLPPDSLQAMLSSLPTGCQETRQETPMREPALMGEYEARQQKETRRILLGIGLLTFALICLVVGVSSGSAALLLLGGSMGTLVVVLAMICQRS
jgi:hypothetical protein